MLELLASLPLLVDWTLALLDSKTLARQVQAQYHYLPLAWHCPFSLPRRLPVTRDSSLWLEPSSPLIYPVLLALGQPLLARFSPE